ncbi:hypothetical protein BZG36_03900 [Bifiguratus adelaidae]|uniref:Branched-chain-amino-acid aminotransferase n=1 Tax=Bifiguratus adelaidae TaxID=1938954 RepID=A0A261XXJ2_9FUNG|nr:hypothetical protein BZG36_03900 [Bifiguratus adelaidae]
MTTTTVTSTPPTTSIDWKNLGFEVHQTNGYVKYTWREDQGWDQGTWETDPYLKVHMSSPGLNYGQECFEGLKAFRGKDGRVRIFRPQENARRMVMSATMTSMTPVPEELFLEGVKRCVQNNLEFVPPADCGGSFYIRPLLFGNGAMIALGPAPEYIFVVFGTPVGNLYRGGAKPVDAWVIEDLDRSAPRGTGAAKLGGNYAPIFLPTKNAKERGYPITLHLDSATRSYIDEFSTSNFVAVSQPDSSKQPTLVTPNSPSILRSITRISLFDLAKSFGWGIEERPIAFAEVAENKFTEAAACGTAAVITPVKKIVKGTNEYTVGEGRDTIGPCLERLYTVYRGIQNGDIEDTFGWMWPAEGF